MSDLDLNGGAWQRTPGDYAQGRPARWSIGEPKSRYLTMRDGCRLALDVYLPEAGQGETVPARLPVIAVMTPYYRRFKVTAPGAEPSPNIAIYRDFFVPRGYALVVLDVRGSGASFGQRDAFRSPMERGDYLEMAQWIAEQPWCNGAIGATGISYLGAASCFLGSTGHPAVKAIAPLFAVSDTYSDHVFPGGIACKTVTSHYDDLILALDRDRREELKAYPYFADPRYAGPAPVDEDPDGALVQQAIREHEDSFLLRDMAGEMAFREEGMLYDPQLHSGACSPYWYLNEVAGKVAVYSVSGWYDGSNFVHGSISRFLTLKGQDDRLLIGPWDHGARTNGSPWRTAGRGAPEFPILSEVLRFFDRHLAGLETGLEAESPVHYFCTHAEQWRQAAQWPPAATPTDWFLQPGRLAPTPAQVVEHAELQTSFAVSSGQHSRYERLRALAIVDYYQDWPEHEARMLSFRSDPLPQALELAGHVLLELTLSCSQGDGSLFAYLSEELADGRLVYINEGCLRLSHRAVSPAPENYRTAWPFREYSRRLARPMDPAVTETLQIAMLPVAWQLAAGSRLRLSLSGADGEHFQQVPHGRPPLYRFELGGTQGCRLQLPVVDPARA
ncbi:CocE/NonD family hydrolase [Xylophilus rhododendri]|uniref:CocE/NonD family hydrolase n=1 Tax=Xylophilus rhododendri TaxID=2697032 RepID=A0A857J392_9BURK|nr:CocE/NonD family hydrolase [Xylophilus rhododendri]QHI97521.1 CocE/NonD family hydrolase [Xylophilus rhododendri]